MKVLIGGNPMGLEDCIPELEEQYPDIEFVHCPDRDRTAEYIADADIYMGWLGREAFLTAEKLKWIQSPSSGINYYLDIPELVANDVLLTSARGTHGACLAESAFGMILAFTRGIRTCIRRRPEKEWINRDIRSDLVELTGSTMGIVGLGTVGKDIANRAKAFDMHVIAVDLYPENAPSTVDVCWDNERLDDLMAESDYVVVTLPYTSETEGMIGREQIACMKPSAMLVGISRGKIIDEVALVEALEGGQLKAAALDVFAHEPLPADSPLWDVEDLLITPHVAGGTQFEGERVVAIFRENLRRFLEDDLPLRNQVDKQRGF